MFKIHEIMNEITIFAISLVNVTATFGPFFPYARWYLCRGAHTKQQTRKPNKKLQQKRYSFIRNKHNKNYLKWRKDIHVWRVPNEKWENGGKSKKKKKTHSKHRRKSQWYARKNLNLKKKNRMQKWRTMKLKVVLPGTPSIDVRHT